MVIREKTKILISRDYLQVTAKENSFKHRETQRFSQRKEEEYKFLFWGLMQTANTGWS